MVTRARPKQASGGFFVSNWQLAIGSIPKQNASADSLLIANC